MSEETPFEEIHDCTQALMRACDGYQIAVVLTAVAIFQQFVLDTGTKDRHAAIEFTINALKQHKNRGLQ